MSSNLKVNSIVPATGTNVAIGTATGTVTLAGTTSGTFSGNLTSGSLSGITSVSTSNLTVNGNAYPSAGPLSNRNLVINGAMQVAQRGTSVTAQNASNEDYSTVDRFGLQMDASASGAVTFSQSTTVPSGNGFTNSVKMVVSTANASPSSGHVWRLYTKLEAQDIANSGWDYTSTSSYLTLSFWARSSLSGTYCINLTAPDVATNWKYISEYTLTADTWKKVTITVPGHASNVFNNDNDIGLEINWIFLAGSLQDDGTADSWLDQDDESTTNQVNWMATVSNEFYITGVQLEVGTVATPFEHRSYGEELALCRRYCEIWPASNTFYSSPGAGYASLYRSWIPFKVEKRTTPAVSTYGIGGYPNNVNKVDTDGVGNDSVTYTNITQYGFRVENVSSPYSFQCGMSAFAEL